MPADVHVWYRETESLDRAAIDQAVSVLSADERAQYSRFHFARDARDYAAAHALLRTALSRHSDCPPASWRFDKTPNGKPFLVDRAGDLRSFSLSHAQGLVACAIADGTDVGVDVERTDRAVGLLEIAARFFSPVETDCLTRLDPESQRQRFFDLWTLKEALVKATGLGLSMSLSSIVFTVDGSGRVTLEAPEEVGSDSWQFALFAPGPMHRLAVAVHRPRSQPLQLSLQTIAPGD